MKLRTVLIGVAVLTLAVPLAWATPEEAAKSYADGKALLAKAEFDPALAAYKAAAKADPENAKYLSEYTVLKRVVALRQKLAGETQAEAWQQMALALCDYYLRNDIHAEALTLAGQLHEKMKNGDSVVLLATAQLASDKDAEAAKLLADLPAEQQSPAATVLRGVALARLGQADEAKAVAAKFEMPKDADAQLAYDAARLYALAGDTEKALKALQVSFEQTPETMLVDVKAEAKDAKDLASVTKAAGFAQVLETKSKVKGCGTASSCGGCTKKSSCASAGKEGEKGKEAGCEGHKETTKDNEQGQKPEKP